VSTVEQPNSRRVEESTSITPPPPPPPYHVQVVQLRQQRQFFVRFDQGRVLGLFQGKQILPSRVTFVLSFQQIKFTFEFFQPIHGFPWINALHGWPRLYVPEEQGRTRPQ